MSPRHFYWTAFADRRLRRTLERIHQQALAMDIFEGCFVWDETLFDEAFLREVGSFIASHPRGYGCWIWKPYIIQRSLAQMPEGSFLLYTDAGCTLNRGGEPRLSDYAAMLDRAGRDVLAFQMEWAPERSWTKMDVCVRLGFTSEAELASGQCIGTAILIRNGPAGRRFVSRWRSLIEAEPHLIDDTPSDVPNAKDFVEHRHDQSVFSILVKQLPGVLVPDETFWPTKPWPKEFPVHATRTRVIGPRVLQPFVPVVRRLPGVRRLLRTPA